jgi:uncharacterized protein
VGAAAIRTNDVEVDLVGVDRWPGARQVTVTGSVKWRVNAPFGQRDFAGLARQRARVPGDDGAKLVVVSRSGSSVAGVDRVYGPADLVAAWA